MALISQVDGSRRALSTIAAIEEGHFDGCVTVLPDMPAGVARTGDLELPGR